MSDSPENDKPWFALGLGLVLTAAMLFLVVTLAKSCGDGKRVIDAYAAALRRGAVVSETVGGAEAAALTSVLRGATSTSISNFQSQANTSCYWVSARAAGGTTELRFVLGDDDRRVVAASIRRRCECPVDADLPCRLLD